MSDFEVIVVGAGPAGAMLTKELAKRKISVVCIEREIEAGHPNKSTAGTPVDTFEIFDIPRELAYEDISGLRIFGPTESYEEEYDKVYGSLFKFRELKQYLIKEAIGYGAHVMVGTDVTGLLKDGGKVKGVTYKGFEGEGQLRANVIVDATGPEALLTAALGLIPIRETKEDPDSLDYFSKPGVGGAFEYFMGNAKPDKGERGYFLDIFLGSEYAPGGYSWIFPTSDHEVKAGVCKMDPTFTVPDEKNQKQYFQKLWDENKQLEGAQPFEVHLCPYRHWVIGGLKKATLDNFISIGDAATKFQPVFGEGIRASFYSAHFAADAIETARKNNDYSQKVLEQSDVAWEKKWGRNWDISRIIYQILYHSEDHQIDEFIRAMRKIKFGTMWNLYLSQGTTRDYVSFIRNLPSFVSKDTIQKLIKLR